MDSDTISTLRPGTMLRAGAYRIIRYLSKGGFGITYLAEHTLLEKQVAIKELYIAEWCNRDVRGAISVGVTANKVKYDKLHRKFISEAKAQCHLDHPGVVRVSDVFEENGTAYYVMDYIDGQSLAKRLEQRRGDMSESEALSYIRQVADALAYVHSTGRLHLDIKPANIMIDRAGRAILIDFGVSKQYDTEGLNDSTLIGHTPGFSSPEQSAGDMRYFSPASDIYSLGATLYNLLTSRRIPDTALRFSGEPIPALPAGISSSTAAAIEASLRLRKDRRPQSIQAFLALLNASDETRKDTAPDPTILPDIPPTIKHSTALRSRKTLWITLSLTAAVAMGTALYFLKSPSATGTATVLQATDSLKNSTLIASQSTDSSKIRVDNNPQSDTYVISSVSAALNDDERADVDYLNKHTIWKLAELKTDRYKALYRAIGNGEIDSIARHDYFMVECRCTNKKANWLIDLVWKSKGTNTEKSNVRRLREFKDLDEMDLNKIIDRVALAQPREPNKEPRPVHKPLSVSTDVQTQNGVINEANKKHDNKPGKTSSANKTKRRKFDKRQALAMSSYSEGLAAVQITNGKWGYVDKQNYWVIEPKYDFADLFSGGRAEVKLNGEYFYINKQGIRVR